jgi:hypothetical protein
VLAQDTFQRPNQTFWGTASDGHTWGGDANTLSAFAISNNAGQVANTSGPANAVLGPSATDSEVVVTGSLSSVSGTNLGAVLHWQDANNWYKAYIDGASLIVQKKVAGSYAGLGSALFTATAGTAYSLHFQIIGTTLAARVWPAGTAEPATWMVAVADGDLTSGFAGLRIQMAGGMTAQVTAFLADTPPGPAAPIPTPTPAPPGVIQTYSLTGGVGDPWGTAFDASGNLWFAEPGCDFAPTCSSTAPPGQLGELPAGSQTPRFFTLPNVTGNQPIFVAVNGAGKVWFTTPNNSMIGEFDPSTLTFVGQWPVTPGSGPWDLTFNNGVLWYTEHYVSSIGRFDTVRHTYVDFPTPSVNSNPYGIAANDPLNPNLVWFTENNSSVARIGVLDTGHGNAISEYRIRAQLPGGLTPHKLSIDAQGNVWWTEGWTRAIGMLNPSAATAGQCGAASGDCIGVTEYPLPPPPGACPTSHVSGISAQRGGSLVWVDDSLSSQVGYYNTQTSLFTLYSLQWCDRHPHDGLNLDGAAHPWWDQEFINALGELLGY